jgi:hypothetical protein
MSKVEGKVVTVDANKCTAEACKSKPERAGFCKTHFVWFKEGLITVAGSKAKDFDKKYQAMLSRSKAS